MYESQNLTDYALLSNPILNKGTGFTNEERTRFGLHGLLPPYVATIEEQRLRSYLIFQSKTSPLEKYIYLRDLQDSNETLFYNLVYHHLEEMMPIIYTPTVGEGCLNFGRIYRRPRGLFISYPNRHLIDEMLRNPRFNAVDVIVVSDGERILGLGDQGAGGMGIPIGKLALYTACAGIHPARTLPILLDTGTDNLNLLKDPLYIGWRNRRIRDTEYDEFIDQFVKAIKKRFPHALLQWEDFAQINATPILEKYRKELCTFNDDIQGTAAIATGTLLAAIYATNTELIDQRIVIAGGGSAGCGIASLLIQLFIKSGLSQEEALERIFLVDRLGLLIDEAEELLPFQRLFAKKKSFIANWSGRELKEVVEKIHPTVLIGVSGQPSLFTEEIIREMAQHVEHPIVFPLSNPTSRVEALPQDLIHWTNGKALIGTGSPFAPILKNGKLFSVDQTNNSYVFPGLGLGLTVTRAQAVTDQMLIIAAQTIAENSPARQNKDANLLPRLSEIRELSLEIARAIAQEAIVTGIGTEPADGLETALKKAMWEPIYT